MHPPTPQFAPVGRRRPTDRTGQARRLQPVQVLAEYKEPLGWALLLLLTQWVVVLFDPHWFLVARGFPLAVAKLPVILYLALIGTLLFGVQSKPAWRARWQWYPPFLLYIAAGAATLPFVINNGIAREMLQIQLLWWVLIVSVATFVLTPKRAELLLILYGVGFLWWAFWGVRAGLVGWHHTLSNYDGFGSQAVGGFAFCYFLAMSAKGRLLKWSMYLTAGLSAMGVVTSFARGAFLAAVLVFIMIWLRSPHKGRTLIAGLGGAALMALAATVLLEDGFFVNEIMSIFEEGTESGTGEDRMILWGAAWQVFLENPILGAGPRNWGYVGARLFEYGELGGMYVNPLALSDMALHNLYMTTLSELGIIGTIALIWIFVDFFRRNAALRTEAAQKRWQALGGGLLLRPLSLGLEAAMIAFMANAALYSMMVIHWFFTMLALNLMLHAIAVRVPPPATPPRRRGARVPADARV